MANTSPTTQTGTGNADGAILTTAIIVGGVYGLRRVGGGQTTKTTGIPQTLSNSSGPAPLGQWLPAYGLTLLGLAIVGEISATVAKAFAILISVTVLIFGLGGEEASKS